MELARLVLIPAGITCVFFGILLSFTGFLSFIGIPLLFLGFALIGMGAPTSTRTIPPTSP